MLTNISRSLVTKDIWKLGFNTKIKIQSNATEKDFLMVQHMWTFFKSILEQTTNLKTFGESLGNKKQFHILKIL
jgi:hypothetical protein